MKSSIFHFPSNNLKSLDIIIMLPLLVLATICPLFSSFSLIFPPGSHVPLLDPDACATGIPPARTFKVWARSKISLLI